MKNVFRAILILTTVISSKVMGHGGSHGDITLAKASELALHRVGKLVDLRRIDPTFVNKFYAVQILALPDSTSGSPAFKAVVYQVPGADGGAPLSVEIILDEKGKALSHKVNNGTSGVSPNWPAKDPLTIAENAFHYLLDNGQGPLKPFAEALTEMTLLPSTDGNGQSIAKATFKSSQTAQVLEVFMTLDGVYLSSQVSN